MEKTSLRRRFAYRIMDATGCTFAGVNRVRLTPERIDAMKAAMRAVFETRREVLRARVKEKPKHTLLAMDFLARARRAGFDARLKAPDGYAYDTSQYVRITRGVTVRFSGHPAPVGYETPDGKLGVMGGYSSRLGRRHHPARLSVLPERWGKGDCDYSEALAFLDQLVEDRLANSKTRNIDAENPSSMTPERTDLMSEAEQAPVLHPHSGYELTGEARVFEHEGRAATLWQIRSNQHHQKSHGQLSGWIENTVTFSHNSKMSEIEAGAQIRGESQIGLAFISADSVVENSKLESYARLKGDSVVTNSAIRWANLESCSARECILTDGWFKHSRMTNVETLRPTQADYTPRHHITVINSSISDSSLESGQIREAEIKNSKIFGGAEIKKAIIEGSTLGYGYRTPDDNADKNETAQRIKIIGENVNNQKYRLDPYDKMEVETGDRSSTFYRIVAVRDIPSHLPRSERGGEIPDGVIPAGTRGGYVSVADVLPHNGDSWIGPDVRLHVGVILRDDVQVWGVSELKSGYLADKTWAMSLRMNGGYVTGNTKIIGSEIKEDSYISDSVIEGSTIDFSSVDKSTVLKSKLKNINVGRSEVMQTDADGFAVYDSTVIGCRLSPGDSSDKPRISDSRLVGVIAEGRSISGRIIDAEAIGLQHDQPQITIDHNMTPRMAEAWSRNVSEARKTGDYEMDIIDPSKFVTHDDPNKMRHYIALALQARDPEVTRYIDTLVSFDADLGSVEPLLFDPDLRKGVAIALASMRGMVVNNRFEADSGADRIKALIEQNEDRINKLPAMPLRRMSNFVVLSHVLADQPSTMIVDGVEREVYPALTRGGDADGKRVYRPAFVEAESAKSGEMERLDIASLVSNTDIVFHDFNAAKKFTLDIAAGRQVVPESALALPRRSLPILVNASIGKDPFPLFDAMGTEGEGERKAPGWWEDMHPAYQKIAVELAQKSCDLPSGLNSQSWPHQAASDLGHVRAAALSMGFIKERDMTLLFKAAPPIREGDISEGLKLSFAGGFQAAIVSAHQPWDSISPLLNVETLDGAVSMPSTAIAIAEARHSRGLDWDHKSHRQIKTANVDLYLDDAAKRQERSDEKQKDMPSPRDSGPGLG